MRRYGAERRPEDRAWLVDRYLPLARHVAARYRGGSEPFEDLEQVAALGLVKAIDRFDAGRGTSFTSYAVPTISGEVRRHFRDHTWALRVPRDLQELAIKVSKAEAALQLELGRAPTAAELADRLDCTVEELLEARDAAGANRMSSLDAPMGSDEDEGASLADMLGADDERLEDVERDHDRRLRAGLASTSARARSCGCASTRSSRRPPSASASGSRRCTSRA